MMLRKTDISRLYVMEGTMNYELLYRAASAEAEYLKSHVENACSTKWEGAEGYEIQEYLRSVLAAAARHIKKAQLPEVKS